MLPSAARSASPQQLHAREHRQVLSLRRHLGTKRFFRRHPWLAHTRPGRRALRFASAWVVIVRRELAETRAQLRPRNPWTAQWFREALCVHSREGAWNAIGYVRGVPTYGGGMQFMLGTWHSVGGRAGSLSDIAAASPREQLYRAWLVWRRDGGSWREWGTAGACGLR